MKEFLWVVPEIRIQVIKLAFLVSLVIHWVHPYFIDRNVHLNKQNVVNESTTIHNYFSSWHFYCFADDFIQLQMVKYVNNTDETIFNQLQHAICHSKNGYRTYLSQTQMLKKLLSGNSLIDNNGTKWIASTNMIANAQWK